MKIKKLVIGTVVASALVVSIGAANAQADPPPERQGTVRQAVIELAGEKTGLEPNEILQELRGGASLADLITANGGDVDLFVADATDLVAERINQALAEDAIRPERAERVLGNLEGVIAEHVNGHIRRLPGRAGNRIERYVLVQAAEQTGLTVDEILGQIREGSSLAAVLEANGVDTGEFIDGLMATAEERANARLAQLREELTSQINQSNDSG